MLTQGVSSWPTSKVPICSAPNSKGIATFVIKADSPLGNLNLNFILIQFDTKRRLPVSSTYLQDSLNSQKNADRKDPFRPYEDCNGIQAANCSVRFAMTESQREKSGLYTWNRGHLTPANPMRFSEDALNNTFYCVNIPHKIPSQIDSRRTIEVKSEYKLKATGGMIMTGVCSANNSVDGPVTYRGWVIPQFFWKLVCYRDKTTQQPKVVAFIIGENTLINANNSSATSERTAKSVLLPRSQKDVLKLLTNPNLVKDAWTKAFKYLTPGREAGRLPSAAQCIKALEISQETVEDWEKFIRNRN